METFDYVFGRLVINAEYAERQKRADRQTDRQTECRNVVNKINDWLTRSFSTKSMNAVLSTSTGWP